MNSNASLNTDQLYQRRTGKYLPAGNFHKAARNLAMERDHHGDQYEIIQQGPELQDSPRSERAADSPRIGHACFYNQVAEVGAQISADSSRSHSAHNSPSLPTRGAGAGQTEAETEDVMYSPNRIPQNRPPLSQLPSDFSHHSDPRSRYVQQQPYVSSSATTYGPPAPAADPNLGHGRLMTNEAAYFYPPSVSHQAPYIYHQTAVYPAPPPHYYYTTAHHVPAPHPFMIGPTPAAAPPPGAWIYASAAPSAALFSPPAAATSSPAHHRFAAFAPNVQTTVAPPLQDSGTCTDDRLMYGREEENAHLVKFRRQSPRESPTHARRAPDYADDYSDYHRIDSESVESKGSESETSPRHSYSSANTNRYHTGAKLEREHGRTPLFGERPSWWGQDDDEEDAYQDEHSIFTSVRSEIEHPRLSAVRTSGRMTECVSDTEATTPFKRASAYQQVGSEQTPETPARHRSSIRMEVSLKDIPTPEEERPERNNEAKPRRPECATAFTIEFSKENESATRMAALDKAQAAERNWKAQSAERMHRNFIRRSLRKGDGFIGAQNQPPKPQQSTIKSSVATEKPNPAPPPSGKTYLLEKMLSATTNELSAEEPSKSPTTENRIVFRIDEATSPSDNQDSAPRRDLDACSDAGTYVVEKDDDELMEARLKIDQVFGVDRIAEEWNDDNDESGRNRTPSPNSPSTETDTTTVMQPVITPRFRNKSPTQQGSADEKPTAASSTETEADKKRKGLLKQLMKTNAAVSATVTAPKSVPVRSKPPPAATPKPPSSAPPTRENASFQARRAAAFNKRASFGTGATTSTNANVSRADAGRYSMRSSSVAGVSRSANPPLVASKALTKTVSSSMAPKPIAAKESETMKLWLRRKEYNPMKAAAEAKKNKATNQQKATEDGERKPEEPVFLSNRSQSFHLGTVMAQASSSSMKKHPSLHGANALHLGCDDDEEEEDDRIGVISDSAAIPGSSLDKESLERLASLSEELGQRAKNVLTRVNRRAAGRSSDALHEMEASRNFEKEAALAALLNQLRVASRALEEVGRILPDEQTGEPSNSITSAQRSKAVSKLKPARHLGNLDV